MRFCQLLEAKDGDSSEGVVSGGRLGQGGKRMGEDQGHALILVTLAALQVRLDVCMRGCCVCIMKVCFVSEFKNKCLFDCNSIQFQCICPQLCSGDLMLLCLMVSLVRMVSQCGLVVRHAYVYVTHLSFCLAISAAEE